MLDNELKAKKFMLLIYAPRGAYNVHRGNGIRNILLNQVDASIPITADIIFSLVSSVSEEDAKKAVLEQFDCKPGYYKPHVRRIFTNSDEIPNKDIEKCFEEKTSEGKEI